MMLSGSRLASLVAYDAPYLSLICFLKIYFSDFYDFCMMLWEFPWDIKHLSAREPHFFLTSGHSGCAHPQSFKQQFLEGQMSLVFFGVKYSHVLKELKTMIKA